MSKTILKTKVANYGKTVAITMDPDSLLKIAEQLPEDSREGKFLRDAHAEALKRAKEDALMDRYKKLFSRETLARFGWNMLEEQHALIRAGLRHGDFRYNQEVQSWTFGPAGAFDREPAETIVMKNAWQPGVFSEKHAAYRMESPMLNQTAAHEMAESMLDEWINTYPLKAKFEDIHFAKKVKLPEGGKLHHGGAPMGATMVYHLITNKENEFEPVFGEAGRGLYVVKFNVRLIYDHGISIMTPPTWGVSYELIKTSSVFDGPFDCVYAGIWGFGADFADCTPKGGLIKYEAFPYPAQEQALEAARNMAISLGMIEGEAGPLPEKMPSPDFENASEQIF